MKKRQRKKNFKKWIVFLSESKEVKQLSEDTATFKNEFMNGFFVDWRGEAESLRKLGIILERE